MTTERAVLEVVRVCSKHRLKAVDAIRIGRACRALGLTLGESMSIASAAEYGGFMEDVERGWRGRIKEAA